MALQEAEVIKKQKEEPKPVVVNPWLDVRYKNGAPLLTREPGIETIDDLPERLGLLDDESVGSSIEATKFIELADTPSDYGDENKFARTDGDGNITWEYPFWKPSGRGIYYREKVAIGHSHPKADLDLFKPTTSCILRVGAKENPWVQWESTKENNGFSAGIADAANKLFKFNYDSPIGTASQLFQCFDAGNIRIGAFTASPQVGYHIKISATSSATYHPNAVLAVESTTNTMIQVSAGTNAGIVFCDATSNPPPGAVIYDHANEWMEILAGGNELLYIKDGWVTTADGVELVVGDVTATNPFVVWDEGTTGGWGGAYGGVVARFRASEAKHTAIVIDAQTGYDPVLGFCENGSVIWAIRNDATEDNFEIRYHVGAANRPDFTIGTTGNVEIVTGKLIMDTAIATAIDIGGSFTGSQITLTGTSATDHAIEIDGVYSAALIYTHTSSATADTLLWGDMASTATSGDFNGLRPRLACNAASGGLNARAVYGEVIVGASKYAAIAQGVLAHVSYAAGSCNITNIHALGVHISTGASLTATNLYGIIVTVQTRGSENISGNDYAMRLDNEAVGGNGRQMDGGIQLVNTNMGGGAYGFTYGLDLSGADIATADIILQNGEIIKNTTDGTIDLSSGNLLTTGALGCGLITTTSGITNTTGTLQINEDAGQSVKFYGSATSGENPFTYFCGYDTGAGAVKYGRISVRADGRLYIEGEQEFMYFGIGNTFPMKMSVSSFAIADNVRYAFGSGDDYAMGYYLTNDTFQLVDGITLGTNVRFLLDASGNIGMYGISAFGTNAAGVFCQGSGTAPTTSPANCFQMYSADIGAGNACAHFRCEGDAIVKIYQQAHIADAVTSHSCSDASETCDRSEIDGFLDALGTKINTIYTALENNGLLASA